MKKIISTIFASVVAALIVWGIQSMAVADLDTRKSANNNIYPTATLTISGINSDVEIYQSKNGIPYRGGDISSTSSEQIIYLPKGQLLEVELTGTSSDLKIDKSIADQVSVNNSGTSSDVTVF